jgi:hypothetical protein
MISTRSCGTLCFPILIQPDFRNALGRFRKNGCVRALEASQPYATRFLKRTWRTCSWESWQSQVVPRSRTQPFPAWPMSTREEATALDDVLTSTKWGGQPFPGKHSVAFAKAQPSRQLSRASTSFVKNRWPRAWSSLAGWLRRAARAEFF